MKLSPLLLKVETFRLIVRISSTRRNENLSGLLKQKLLQWQAGAAAGPPDQPALGRDNVFTQVRKLAGGPPRAGSDRDALEDAAAALAELCAGAARLPLTAADAAALMYM